MKKQLLLVIGLIATAATTSNAQVMDPDLTSYGYDACIVPTGGSYFGYRAGNSDLDGKKSGIWNYNTFIGNTAGQSNKEGQLNTFLGHYSGPRNETGSTNVFLGAMSGYSNTKGNGNIYIGFQAAYNLEQDNTFIVNNNAENSPFLYGDIAQKKLGVGGFDSFPSTAGGVDLKNYKLFVKGGILTEQVRVSLEGTWADYVFLKDYKLRPLNEVETYIKENGHLPNVPSAQQVKEDGIELGEMAKIQQEKIEELTLYLIEQQKQIDELKAQFKALSEQPTKQ